jgi:dihydrofolate reductase
MISLLLAMDRNRLIGKDNDLPWHLPADLAYFKRITMGHAIVMGRKTYESIGRALPGRENIVLTRDPHFSAEGCRVIHSLDEIKKIEEEQQGELFVIGGAELFNQVLSISDRLYITVIDEIFEGDTYFTEINENEWTLISSEKGITNEKNIHDHFFNVYERKK